MINHHTRNTATQTEVKITVHQKVQVKNSDFEKDETVETSENAIIEFKKYPCFYCAIDIISENHLKEHKEKCHGSHQPNFLQVTKFPLISKPKLPKPKVSPQIKLSLSSFSLQPLFSFPVGFPQPSFSQNFLLPKCEKCGWLASSGTDLMKLKKAIHGDFENPFGVYK